MLTDNETVETLRQDFSVLNEANRKNIIEMTKFLIISAGVGLIASIFFGKEANFLFSMIGLDFLKLGTFGAMVIIIGPLIGVFSIILFRFTAEQLRLRASLVNNTKEIAATLRKTSE